MSKALIDFLAQQMGVAPSALTGESVFSWINGADAAVIDAWQRTGSADVKAFVDAFHATPQGSTVVVNMDIDAAVAAAYPTAPVAPVTPPVTPVSTPSVGITTNVRKFANTVVAPTITTTIAEITSVRVSKNLNSKGGALLVVEVKTPSGEVQIAQFSAEYTAQMVKSGSPLDFTNTNGVHSPKTGQLVYIQLENRVAGRTTWLSADSKDVAAAGKQTVTRRVNGSPTLHAICLHETTSNVFAGFLGTQPTREEYNKLVAEAERYRVTMSAKKLEIDAVAAASIAQVETEGVLTSIRISQFENEATFKSLRIQAARAEAEKYNDLANWKDYLI